ncbi:cell division protein FtsQ/DivIB [Atopobium deltae]|uniref:POTRA domain protein, FtsQ-type n=1 Tax=Atopobium deltae TaxID=1393034 RepID=A0A133XUN1_9ACTN|nr:FtsQ-type POTRA domain-containing protein [Atopobium deltae]KXB34654.1 POTRA domain protein, FtsQ-type [Atopobium deltae]
MAHSDHKKLKPTKRTSASASASSRSSNARDEKKLLKHLKKQGASPARLEARQSLRQRLQALAAASSQAGSERAQQQSRGISSASTSAKASRGSRMHLPVFSISLKKILLGFIGIAAVGGLLFVLLMHVPIFRIESIDAPKTSHMTSEVIAKLANIPAGVTLLNASIDTIANNIKRNPWAEEVRITRVFPNKLRIEVKERTPAALVLMNSGDIAWYIGQDGTWIEPCKIAASKEQSAYDIALAQATKVGCLFVWQVPASVNPQAATKTTDPSVLEVLRYVKGFSKDFSKTIVSYAAASSESVSCVLSNGIEVSLGAAHDITTKEATIKQLIEQHPNQITFINVRVPSRPSYRKVGAESVDPGTGGRVVGGNPANGNPANGNPAGNPPGDNQAGDKPTNKSADKPADPKKPTDKPANKPSA